MQLCTDFLLPIVNSPLIRRGLNRTLGGSLNKSLRRYLTSLLLFFVFAAVRTGYGQTTDYAALRSAGRVEHWAGHFEKAEILLRSALEAAQGSGDADEQALAAQILHSLSTVYFRQENMSRAEA